MLTGFGKSLVYELLPFCAERLLKAQPLQGMPQMTRSYVEMVEGRVTHLFGSPVAFIGNEKWRYLFVDRSINFSTRVVATAINLNFNTLA